MCTRPWPLPSCRAPPTWCRLSVPGLPPCSACCACQHPLHSAAALLRTPLAQAHKRGLDVDKLHDSRTPAWRNLRGRSASQRKRSYYEGPEQEDEDDEVEDQPSGSEEEPEEEEEEVGGSGPRGGGAEWACCRVLERASALPSGGRQGTMGCCNPSRVPSAQPH